MWAQPTRARVSGRGGSHAAAASSTGSEVRRAAPPTIRRKVRRSRSRGSSGDVFMGLERVRRPARGGLAALAPRRRERDLKRGSGGAGRDELDVSVVALEDPLGDRQAQAAAVGAAGEEG